MVDVYMAQGLCDESQTYSFLPGAGEGQGLDIRSSLTRNVREPVMSIRETCGKPPSMPLTVDGVLFQ